MSYTNLLQHLNKHIEDFRELLEKQKLVGKKEWGNLLLEIINIRDSLNTVAELDNYTIKKKTQVDVLGLAPRVITLTELGKSPEEISGAFLLQGVDLPSKEIKSFLADYNTSTTTSKIEVYQNSVFDTQLQLQTVFDRLHTLLQQAESTDSEEYYKGKTTKQQVLLDYMREIRQSIKDASNIAEKVAAMKQIETFKQIVVEEVGKVDGAAAARIWKRIREAKTLFHSLELK